MPRSPLSYYRPGDPTTAFGDPFPSLNREFGRLLDEVLRGAAIPAQVGSAAHEPMLRPHIDVSETEKELHIRAELPGVKEDDVEVTLTDDVLTIRGEKRLERKDEKENYHFIERSYGSFQRSMRIPYQINPDDVKAEFENGVLTVSFPKAQIAARNRRIRLQKGASASGSKVAEKAPPGGTQEVPPARNARKVGRRKKG